MYYPSRFVSVAASAVMLASLMACAPMNPAPVSTFPTSTSTTNTQGAFVEFGRVNNVEIIRTQTPPTQSSGVGAVIGGVAGAVVGSQIGGGSGRTAATVIGAVGGAVAGNAIEVNRNTQPVNESYRISVQLDNGVSRAFDVPAFGDLRIGDRVKIENNQLFRIL